MVSEIKTITARALPLVGDDIDTDRIIPARYLRSVTFDGLGEAVFIDDRAQLQGQHAFDQPQFQGAKILVVNRNFGCGSSREHAPQAIAKWGIEAIIGESFAEIFLGNCVAIGIPCVTADASDVRNLQMVIAENPESPVELNLETLQANYSDFSFPIEMNQGSRMMFTSGTWDACGQLVAQVAQIKATAAQLPYLRQFSTSAP